MSSLGPFENHKRSLDIVGRWWYLVTIVLIGLEELGGCLIVLHTARMASARVA